MKTFPLAKGAPMYLLSELGLHEAFLDTIERHRRDSLPLVLNRGGRKELVEPSELGDKASAARVRIFELEAEIPKHLHPFSLNETP